MFKMRQCNTILSELMVATEVNSGIHSADDNLVVRPVFI